MVFDTASEVRDALPDDTDTDSTAQKAPGPFATQHRHQQQRLESPRAARRPRNTLRSSSLASLVPAVLAVPGLADRPGPFHSHPGGWPGQRTPGDGQVSAPLGMARPAHSWGWPD